MNRLLMRLSIFCRYALGFFAVLAGTLSCKPSVESLPPPNVLWITSEDNSPFFGCYGDSVATTPNLDRLASRGFLYTHAYANAPVCAPSRNTIITGVYANSGGHEHMRSTYRMSEAVKLYPEFLRDAGYYCTNNVKEDFNIHSGQTRDVWNEVSKTAHYKNRPNDQPFFAIFNSTITHESSLHQSTPPEDLRHKPGDMALPPYHPDTDEIRRDWAQYYDKIEDMDAWVGSILNELEESGEAENTIVFYYADHGGVLGRSKRFVYETGTHIPFIVYIPEKYKHLYPAAKPGMKVDRLISLVDLAPTLMSILGRAVPDYLQGSAFLGDQRGPDPKYVYMFRGRMDERYDMSRAVRDSKYRYIRNYMPHREYAQYIEYLWRAPSMKSWEAACEAGECNDIQRMFWNAKPAEELYDTERDPWEVNNLAGKPEYREVLERMRAANRNWMLEIKDTGFIPEGELADRAGEGAAYDYMRNEPVNLEQLIDAADFATTTSADGIARLVSYMKSPDPAVRYWGATGLLIQHKHAHSAIDDLMIAASDSSADVAVVAGEVLYRVGKVNSGRRAIIAGLKAPNAFARTRALNAIDCLEDDSPEVREGVLNLFHSIKDPDGQDYDWRSAQGLLRKWKVEAGM